MSAIKEITVNGRTVCKYQVNQKGRQKLLHIKCINPARMENVFALLISNMESLTNIDGIAYLNTEL